MDTRSPESAAESAAAAGPAALADLIAAGLVSHEMIGDPGRLGGEAEALRLLCGLVAGPVWRIEPYHYAFRAGPDRRRPRRPGGAALEAALQAELGADAVWVSATERPEASRPRPAAPGAARAGRGGAGALAAAGPELQAVIGARFAAARRPADVGRGRGAGRARSPPGSPRSRRGRRRSSRRSPPRPRPSGRAGARPARGDARTVLRRLDAQADVLHAHIAREDMVAGRLAELAALAGAPGGLPGDARADARRVPRPARGPRRGARRPGCPRPAEGEARCPRIPARRPAAPDPRHAARRARAPARAARRAARPAAPGPAETPPGGAAAPDDAGADDAEAALEEFLRALTGGATAAAPDRRPAPAPEPAAVLHFQRPEAPRRPAPRDLDRLPGAGPGLVGALERAGLARLADIAPLAPEELAARLGPIGRLVPAEAWIAAAREAAPPA